MRSAGAWVAVLLVACGGSETGLLPDGGGILPDGGPAQPGDIVLDVHDALTDFKRTGAGSCDHPDVHDAAVLVRGGYWIEVGNHGSIQGQIRASDGHVVAAGTFGEWPDGNVQRVVDISQSGSVTGTTRFSNFSCEATYTTTGQRR